MNEITFGNRWSEFHPMENGDIMMITGEVGKQADTQITFPAFVVPVFRLYFSNERTAP